MNTITADKVDARGHRGASIIEKVEAEADVPVH